jgi:glutathione S-transferase
LRNGEADPTLLQKIDSDANSMKLYGENNPAPNPRKVRIYLAEKGIEVEQVRVPLRERAHKAPAFLKKNSLGQLPVLELDDGTCIAESVAICRYFEDLHPAPALFGRDALGRAMVEMWIRRAEFRLWNPMSQVWIHSDPRTAAVVPHQYRDFGEMNRKVVAGAMKWINGEMADGREFLSGDTYSMADIVLLCGIDFAKFVNMEMPEDCEHLHAWHARVSVRPSSLA